MYCDMILLRGISMSKNQNFIKCPNCGEEINIESLIQAGAKDEIEKKLALQQAEFNEQIKVLKAQNSSLAQKYEEEKFKEIEEAIKAEKKKQAKAEEDLRKKITEENAEANELLQKELEEKTSQLKEFNKLKAEKSRLEREKESLEDEIKAKAEEELQIKLAQAKQTLQQNAEKKYELKIIELEEKLKAQVELTKQMQEKQEQGSMQAQGEAQELAIEKYLSEHFKLDDVSEIKKGANGADTFQVVKNDFNQPCGSIYYESKRTKTFSSGWISKFRDDMQEKGADIGVLVTTVYPNGMERMELREGIYICSFEEFKALAPILRNVLIEFSNIKALQQNQHEKSVQLYNFLTSNEFKLQFETIYNCFNNLRDNLQKEKNAMNKIWKQREKELDNVLKATTGMYGSIQGIAGNAIPVVEALELPLLGSSEDI